MKSSQGKANIGERLQALRALMARDGVDAFYIPAADAHQSEYVPDCWQRRTWISDFDGSAGFVVVTRDKAWLWTDSRYFLQAESQLDNRHYGLHKQGQPGVPSLTEWVEANGAGKSVAVDATTISHRQAASLGEQVRKAGGTLKLLESNYVDAVWQERPALPPDPAVVWPEKYAGRSAADKIGGIRKVMAAKGCAAHVLSMLDAIMWTFNVRGSDVGFNPVLVSYAVITADKTELFTDPRKITGDVAAHLRAANVTVRPYAEFAGALAGLKNLSGKVWIDGGTMNQHVVDRLQAAGVAIHDEESPVTLAKAVKNPTEQQGMRAAHVRDGVAMVKFLHWLEGAWQGGQLDELNAAEQLLKFRAEGELFRGPSFDTISGFGPNGAVVHYRSSPATNRKINDQELYLVDSGGQYWDGTTDITRTVHLGKPKPKEIEHYTLVLKAHVSLGRAIFPKGTSGEQVDIFARGPLWEHGLNYGHGTGHGVGCYLNVHEGPHRIAYKSNGVPLQPGMIVSNEPGYYRAGQYGIRVENLVMITARPDIQGDEAFYGFEDLTMVPHCRRLIDVNLLTAAERAYVNQYHAKVLAALRDRVPANARAWLERETASL